MALLGCRFAVEDAIVQDDGLIAPDQLPARLLPDAFGPLLGGVLSDHFGLRTNFFVTGAYLLIPICVMYFLVQERDYTEPGEGAGKTKKPAGRFRRPSDVRAGRSIDSS